MAYLLYYLVLLPLSYLPLRVLYSLSGLLDALNWHLIGYRKRVVRANLKTAFPRYSAAELDRLARSFYRFFFDNLAESIKQFSLAEGAAVRRCKVVNPDVVDHLLRDGRSFIAYGAHYGNWEMAALSFPCQFPGFRVMGIYSPLKSRVLNRLFTNNRARTGTYLVSRRAVDEYYDIPPPVPTVDFFIADQSPSNAVHEKLHWTTFLGHPTAFLAGPERYAVRHDRPVYYMTLRREARGCYVAELIPVTDTPQAERPGVITEAFARQLEREILRDPVTWLWSHRRWKRVAPAGVVQQLKAQAYLAPEYER